MHAEPDRPAISAPDLSPLHSGGGRVATVDLLRCVAGTMVLWYHFTFSSQIPWLKASGRLGWSGVHVFFVVSGFIIPFAMARSGFAYPGDVGRFIARRLIRLDPPYFVASAAAAVIAWAAWKTPGFRGPEPAITWAHTLAHIGYFNGILGMPWYDPVCWTLGIEFQFYIAMAVVFPLVVTRRFARFAVLETCLLMACAWVHQFVRPDGPFTGESLLVTWIPCFLLGIAAFRYRYGIDSLLCFGMAASAAMIVGLFTNLIVGMTAALAATGFIMVPCFPLPRLLSSYASLTYSLYLVHVPFGQRLIRLLQRIGPGIGVEIFAVLAGLATSMVAAYLLFRFVEQPAMKLASRITMHGRESR